tara:strand:- start:11409 stop:11831 length:423 start_codon:yes stop_codon:yes gene_type:complete
VAKKTKRKKLIEKLDKVFSIYIRQRYAINEIAKCFTCGKKDHWKKLQCGHFQSRKNYSTRFGTLDDDDKITELNCQVQCAGCNVFRYGEQYLFAKYLDDTYYNGLSEELYIKSKKIVKLDNFDLEMLISKYQNLTDKLTK